MSMSSRPITKGSSGAAPPLRPSRPPYRSRAAPSTPPPHTLRRYRKTPIIVGGFLAFGFSASASFLYTSISKPACSDPSLPAQDSDVSGRYNSNARTLDNSVDFYEQFSGIRRWRKRLAREAEGHVLEVSAGTGRNSDYYKLKKCKSLSSVDLSGPMVELAEKKFKRLYPKYDQPVPQQPPVAFVTQSALEPLPDSIIEEVTRSGGYDTILQTMGLCSTPKPARLLMHLGTLAHPERGKILLLEHGRSHYDWLNNILDKMASERADKQGCWWNRDIEQIIEDSGLVVERMRRKHLGTLYIVEARPKRHSDTAEGKDGGQEVIDEVGISWPVARIKALIGRDPGVRTSEEEEKSLENN